MTVNLMPFPPSPTSLPVAFDFHRPASCTLAPLRAMRPDADKRCCGPANSSSLSEIPSSSSSSASGSRAVCSNSYSFGGMWFSGMEMLNVLENSSDRCEGDDSECVPSDWRVSVEPSLGDGHAYRASVQSLAPRRARRTRLHTRQMDTR